MYLKTASLSADYRDLAEITQKRVNELEAENEMLKGGQGQATVRLDCAICCYNFDDDDHCPVLFNCGHTVCESCMLQMTRSSLIGGSFRMGKCPFCHPKDDDIVPLPLRKNWTILGLIQGIRPISIPSFILYLPPR